MLVKVYKSYVLSLLHLGASQIEVQYLHNSFSDKWDQFDKVIMFLSDSVTASFSECNLLFDCFQITALTSTTHPDFSMPSKVLHCLLTNE